MTASAHAVGVKNVHSHYLGCVGVKGNGCVVLSGKELRSRVVIKRLCLGECHAVLNYLVPYHNCLVNFLRGYSSHLDIHFSILSAQSRERANHCAAVGLRYLSFPSFMVVMSHMAIP